MSHLDTCSKKNLLRTQQPNNQALTIEGKQLSPNERDFVCFKKKKKKKEKSYVYLVLF